VPEVTNINVKLPKEMKRLFLKLCEDEGIDISQGVRELITEALARGYLIKDRRDRVQKIRNS